MATGFLVLSIVFLVILIGIYIHLLILAKRVPKEQYDYIYKPPKYYLIISNLVFWIIGIGLLVAATIIGFLKVNDILQLVLAIVGAVIGIFAYYACLISKTYFQAIKEYKVYGGTVHGVSSFEIKDIKSIKLKKTGYYAVDFEGDIHTIEKSLIEPLKNIRNNILLYPIEETEEEIRQKEIFSSLGREYRDNFIYYKKRRYIIFTVEFIMSLVISSIIIYLPFALNYNLVGYIFIGFFSPGLLFLFIRFLLMKKAYKTELEKDNYELGLRHKFENKKVKGASLHFYSIFFTWFGFLLIFGVIISIGTYRVYARDPVKQENLTVVYGELECYSSIDSEPSFGIKNYTVKFMIPSIGASYVDKSFVDEVKVGDYITLYVEGNPRKARWWSNYVDDIATITFNNKQYYTYENYLNTVKERKGIYLNFFIVGITSTSVSLAVYVTCVIKSRFDRKKEVIEVKTNKNPVLDNNII